MSLFVDVSFDHYFAMWNEPDLLLVRFHLDQAVTEDLIFCDPLHFHVGRDALEANARKFRTEHPTAEVAVASGIDSHHNRHRYDWHITIQGQIMLQGFDVATVADNGLIERIDGFFGTLPDLPGDLEL
jgi:hypothetical protein